MDGVEVGRKKFWTKRKLGAAAVVLAFAASNVSEYSRWSRFNESGPMVIPYAGCEIEYFPEEDEQKLAVEEEQGTVKSTARSFTIPSVNTPDSTIEKPENVERNVKEFVMEESGIRVKVHKSKDTVIDEEKFAEVFHAPLKLDEEYTHPEVRQLVECWRQDIIEEKKHEGTTYNVYLADGPGYCIKGLRFHPADLSTSCDASGAAIPEIEIQFLWFNLFNKNIMMLSSRSQPEYANEHLTETLLHESVHAYMTLSDMPLRLDPDERLAEYVEDVTEENYYDNDVGVAIFYPEP